MKSEQEIRETRDRALALLDRFAAFADNADTCIASVADGLTMSQGMHELSITMRALSWALGMADADNITDEERDENFVSMPEYLMACERFIDRLYARSKEARDAIHRTR